MTILPVPDLGIELALSARREPTGVLVAFVLDVRCDPHATSFEVIAHQAEWILGRELGAERCPAEVHAALRELFVRLNAEGSFTRRQSTHEPYDLNAAISAALGAA